MKLKFIKDQIVVWEKEIDVRNEIDNLTEAEEIQLEKFENVEVISYNIIFKPGIANKDITIFGDGENLNREQIEEFIVNMK